MQETLITFPTAKLAKEKGFDIPTLYGCNEKGELQEYFTYASYSTGEPEIRIEDFISKWEYQLPSQSLLQKWLREVHTILIVIEHKIEGDIENSIIKFTSNTEKGKKNNIWYDTYEEALEIGLQEALKLIE